MKKLLISIMIAGLVLFTSCAGTGSTVKKPDKATITDGVMTTSVDNSSMPTGGIKTSFSADTPAIYCSFKLNGVAQEDMIKATWTYLNGEAKDKENTVLNETYDIAQNTEISYYLAFYIDKPAGGWYKGDYKVVLSINNVEKLAVPFKIE